MKKLVKLVVLTMMVFFICSCGNNGGQTEKTKNNASEQSYYDETIEEEEYEPEKFFSYQLLESHEEHVKFNYGWDKFVGNWIEDCGCRFEGLAICYGDMESSQYLLFDDEEDYYNDCIYEWTMALKIAQAVYNANNRRYSYTSDGDTLYQVNMKGDTLITFKHSYLQYYDDGKGKSWNKNDDYAIDSYGDTIIHGKTIKSYENIYFENNKRSISEILNYLHCFPSCIDDYKNSEIVEIVKKTYYNCQDASVFQPERGYGYRSYPIDGFGSSHVDALGFYHYVKLFRIKEGEYEGVPAGTLGICFKSNL